ncbi:MAG: hypothetical protein A2W84_18200 [Bacteroidetes bacterium GWC2_40_13]|nr:MAG: hypothetical protein A2W84_18200 [Bacteroidetes bacterium GWC2_40_13]
MKKGTFISIIALISINTVLFGQDTLWSVPEDQLSKAAPVMFTGEMQKAGEDIYAKNCKSCHGDMGQGNMAKLNPLPKDLSSLAVSKQTDGALHYKITNGRGLMPVFKNTLSGAQIWEVISYIRKYHKDYKQPEPSMVAAFGGKTITLTMDYLPDLKGFKIIALGKEKDADVPAEGVEIALFVKRYFGLLKIDDSKITDKQGEVFFNEPAKLPGDKEGNLQVIAKVVDTEKYGDVAYTKEVAAGIPTEKPSLTENRAIWNVGRKAPWWVTVAYPLTVLAVLGTIGYIILLLKKIYLSGKEQSDNLN